MAHYILLLFDHDDGVAVVRTVAAGSNEAAKEIAQVAQMAHNGCVGYQLWRNGQRIATTLPFEKRKNPSRPDLVA
jgi:hypothetical protein